MTYTLTLPSRSGGGCHRRYAWYEEMASGLGEEFLRIFYACAGKILGNPLLYSKVYREFRRCLLRRFPYTIYSAFRTLLDVD